MGFFSFKTADKGESIAIMFEKDHPNANKTVYMLEPNSETPISEPLYCGFGLFGGIDCFEWIARRNLSTQEIRELENSDSRALRMKGIDLHYGGTVKYPLKFSFDINAKYENLPPSESCGRLGASTCSN